MGPEGALLNPPAHTAPRRYAPKVRAISDEPRMAIEDLEE